MTWMELAILFFLLGIIFGSFGSVVVARVPKGEPITGRSQCPCCGSTLKPLELVPIVSYLAQNGKCRTCNVGIAPTYLLLEVLSGLLFLTALQQTHEPFVGFLLGLFLWLLLCISMVDAETQTIPDILSIPLIFIGFAFSISFGTFSIWGPLLGGGFFGVQWLLSRGRWIGSGDILLGLGIGAMIADWRMVAVCLVLTYAVGAMVSSFLIIRGSLHRRSYVPFGPFLAIGTYLVILFHERITTTVAILEMFLAL